MATPIDIKQTLQKLIEEQLSQIRSERAEIVPEPSLTWLALAPVWPLKIAERRFPIAEKEFAEGEKVKSLLEEAVRADICEMSDTKDEWGEVSYWMNRAQRSSALKMVLEQHKVDGLDYVRYHLLEAGRAVAEAARGGPSLNPTLERWVQLALKAQHNDKMAALLDDKVEQSLLEAYDCKATAAPETLRWIETAQPFAELFGGTLEVALVHARRKLEVFHFHAHDAHYLSNYLERQEQIRAFDELMSNVEARNPDDPWALHYIGNGGSGKTMLLRYITVKLASRKHRATARIDFDSLNPDYPSRAPGLLLIGLMVELKRYASPSATKNLRLFEDGVKALHSSIEGAFRQGTVSTVSTDDEAFKTVLNLFIEVVKDIGRQPLLILDTCEELAKVRSDGKVPPNVSFTFDMLEKIHDELPDLRVIFAGRRPLASEGFGWSCPSSKLPSRPYLRLQPIRGFSETEAREFLKGFRKSGREVNPELFEAIMQQSLASDKSIEDRFNWTNGAPDNDSSPRYNPFDLNMYAAWASTDKTFNLQNLINAGAHFYIKERILDKINNHLRALLPSLTLLGIFDKEVLARLLNLASDHETVSSTLEDLANQEWISSIGNNYLMVDETLRERLRDYYLDKENYALESASRALGNILEDLTLGLEWRNLMPAYFDAALRALSSNPVRAAQWWEKVEARLAAYAQWDWAKALTDSLLSDDGAAGRADVLPGQQAEQEHFLRPAILATRAASLTHLGATDMEALWEEVLAECSNHPIPEGVAGLKFRALAGLIAASCHTVELLTPQDSAAFFAKLEERLNDLPTNTNLNEQQRAASEIAMLEGIVEVLERFDEEAEKRDQLEFTNRCNSFLTECYLTKNIDWAESLPPDLQIFYLTLRARWLKLAGRLQEAYEVFARVVDKLDVGDCLLQQWLDWQRPAEFGARIMLEYARAMYPTYLPAEQVLVRIIQTPLTIKRLDSDRLASIILILRGSAAALPLGEDYEENTRRSVQVQSRSTAVFHNAHRLVPPYFVVALEAKASQGALDQAVWQCVEFSKDAEARGDTRTQLLSDRALVRIAHRLRLRDERGFVINTSVDHSQNLNDIGLRFRLLALDGSKAGDKLDDYFKPEDSDRRKTALTHVKWYLRRAEVNSVAMVGFSSHEPDATFEEFSLELDSLEALCTANFRGGAPQMDDAAASFIDSCREWIAANPAQPVEGLTLYLRTLALTTSEAKIEDVPQELVARVGKRRAAHIAFDEGSLLALRIPHLGGFLLRASHQWFKECGEHLCGVMASTSLAMLAARLKSPDAKDRAAAAKDEYIACSKTIALMPPLEPFLRLMDTKSDSKAIEQFTHNLDVFNSARVLWRPWLVRLLVCLTRVPEFAPPAFSKALRDWIDKNYSTINNEVLCLPAEFEDPNLYASGQTIVVLNDTSENLPNNPLRTILFVTLFVGGFAAANYFLIKLLGSLGLSVLITSFVIPVVLIIFSYILARLMPTVSKWYISMLATLTEIRYVIDGPAQGGDINHPLRSPIQIGRRRTPQPGSLRERIEILLRKKGSQLQMTTPQDVDEYRLLPTVLPKDFRKQLGWLNNWLGKYGLGNFCADIKIYLDEKNAATPWEAVFGLASEKVETFQQIHFRFRRIVKVRDIPQSGAFQAPVGVLTLAPNFAAVQKAKSSWSLLAEDTALFKYEALEPRDLSDRTRWDVGVIHLVGALKETSSGLRLEVSKSDTLDTTAIYSQLASLNQNEEDADDSTPLQSRRELLRSGEIAVRFPRLRICIIQETPSEIQPRTSVDRFEAGLLRRFGAELFRRGIPCVLLLPSVPDEISLEVVHELARLLMLQPRQGKYEMLETVRTIQQIISERGHRDAAARLEMALDVCLYMVKYFDMEINQES